MFKGISESAALVDRGCCSAAPGWNANPITIRSQRVFELKSSLNLCRFPFFKSLFRVNLVVLVGMKEVHQCENKTSPQQQNRCWNVAMSL